MAQQYNEKKRLANKKWDDAHMKTGSYKMYIDMFAEFEKYCIDNNISKNAVINKAVAQFIGYNIEQK